MRNALPMLLLLPNTPGYIRVDCLRLCHSQCSLCYHRPLYRICILDLAVDLQRLMADGEAYSISNRKNHTSKSSFLRTFPAHSRP